MVDFGDLATCMFWKSPDSVVYVQGSTSQSVYYSPMVYLSNIPMVGNFPQIQEELVDFGRNFKMQAIYNGNRRKKFEISIKFWDGEKNYKIRKINVEKNADGVGEVELWGGLFKLTQADVKNKKSVLIEVLKVPTGKPSSGF